MLCSVTFTLLLAVASAAAAPAPPAPFAAERFRQHAAYLASDELQGRAPGAPGGIKAAEYVQRQFRDLGLAPQGDDDTYFQKFTWNDRPCRNVLGLLPGKGSLAEQAVIVCAHYDHLGVDPKRVEAKQDGIFNGADDNASGVAVVLLMAQALVAQRAELPAVHRSVIFLAFDAEEAGLRGARHYLDQPRWPLEKTSAAINFDLVGRLRQGKLYAGDIESGPALATAVGKLAPQCGLRVETRLSGARRSDHVPFLDGRIAAVQFMTGIHQDYHQVTDEVDKLDCAGGARIAWLAFRLLREVMADPQPIVYRRPNPAFDAGAALRVIARLGIVPNLNDQGGRYPQILFVVPGSPAAKHGLQSRDEITAINGATFDRAEDVLFLWGQLNLDKGLRLAVQRKDKTAEVTLPAELFQNLAGPTVRPLAGGRFEVAFKYRPANPVKSVYLAGSFNDWRPTAHKMDGPDADGAFTTRLELKPGEYEYKFVRDGQQWQSDPNNIYQTGENGNSLLSVGEQP